MKTRETNRFQAGSAERAETKPEPSIVYDDMKEAITADAANQFIECFPTYICSDKDTIHRWNGRYFKEIQRTGLEAAIERALPPPRRNPNNISSIAKMVMLKCYRQPEEMEANSLKGALRQDGDEIRANCQNCVVKIKESTGEISREKHDERWLFTQEITTNYEPEAKCPEFMGLLDSQLPEKEDRRLIRLQAGTIFLPYPKYQVALILRGRTRTSKSTILEAIQNALGKQVTSAVNLRFISEDKGRAMEKLEHSMFNLSGEVDQTILSASSNFKLIISGERVWCDPKFKVASEKRTSASFFLSCNVLPSWPSGEGEAEVRRIRVIEMNERIDDDSVDPELPERLKGEAEGILVWALTAVKELAGLKVLPY